MPIHLSVSSHGDAAAKLVAHIESASNVSVSSICRMMSHDIVVYMHAYLPGVPVPDEAAKAESLRRQWYRWLAGKHVPDTDDLGALLQVARREGWVPPRGQPIPNVPRNVAALIAEVDRAEASRKTLQIERALMTHRLQMSTLARQVVDMARHMPHGVWDIVSVVRELSDRIIEEVRGEFVLGGAAALRAEAPALVEQWIELAVEVEREEREVEQLESDLL
jgi:hypothetical protein